MLYCYLLVVAKTFTTSLYFPPPLEFTPCFVLHVRLHCFIYLFSTYLGWASILQYIKSPSLELAHLLALGPPGNHSAAGIPIFQLSYCNLS